MRERTATGLGLIVAAAMILVLSWPGLLGPPAPPPPRWASEVMLGGEGTVSLTNRNAFSMPLRTLSQDRRGPFFVGNSFFNENWVQAPASAAARDGLGPVFNARSCSGCHFKDGRGHVDDLLVRLSLPDGRPEPRYGEQLQPHGIQGVPGEGRVEVDYEEIVGRYADGEAYRLRKPRFRLVELAHGPLHPQTLTSPRVAPAVHGLGLLMAIREADLLARADPDDADGDGISGRPNRVRELRSGRLMLGRLGWKANQPTIEQQVAGAFLGDMGLTTSLRSDDRGPVVQAARHLAVSGGSPEVSDHILDRVVFYTHTLAVPAGRNADDPQAQRGRVLFERIGCASCHTPSYTTGPLEGFPELSGQRIHPFTDLLLHDMGADLADGRPDGLASGREWRTPPLWGLGLSKTVAGHLFLLHDGRARTIAEAILWHGGEGERARQAFRELSKAEREALLRFLESL